MRYTHNGAAAPADRRLFETGPHNASIAVDSQDRKRAGLKVGRPTDRQFR